jgi:methylenetetrahydrofolate reductase (NADPH)
MALGAEMNRAALEPRASTERLTSPASALAASASIELGRIDVPELADARALLGPGRRVHVSHLPRQTWEQTFELAAQVARAGFDPVPHVPVRLIGSGLELDMVLRSLRDAGARELLLISGDYPQARGPFSEVRAVLERGRLQALGFARVSFAGHPEGHPAVPADEIRRAQIAKARLAAEQGLEVTLVTQFFFETEPFIEWARDLRFAGVAARLVAGLPGPAGVTQLLKLARHCGVGPSMRALTSRPGNLLRLMTEHRPDALLNGLADAKRGEPALFDGIHLFSFGGLRRTAAWLDEMARDHSAQV